jgi:hypothetical protein
MQIFTGSEKKRITLDVPMMPAEPVMSSGFAMHLVCAFDRLQP